MGLLRDQCATGRPFGVEGAACERETMTTSQSPTAADSGAAATDEFKQERQRAGRVFGYHPKAFRHRVCGPAAPRNLMGEWLPEPVPPAAPLPTSSDPIDRIMLDESVAMGCRFWPKLSFDPRIACRQAVALWNRTV